MRLSTRFVSGLMGTWLLLLPAIGPAQVEADLEAADSEACHKLRLNQMQVVVTHNSYHVRPEEPLLSQVKTVYPKAMWWDYSHAPLDVQLDRGVRSFELDVYHDPAGTKVMHVPQYDSGSTCPTLVEGLKTLRAWSREHPRHVPLIVLVELKDEPIREVLTPILPYDEAALDQLDREIRSVFEPAQLLTPDEVRGGAPTLSQAIRVRGKVMLVLHARGVHAERYTKGRPSLEGRAMFLESQEGQPYASVFIRNNPHDSSIARLVREGYLVRTRADSGLQEGALGTAHRRDAALASGAHIVSTDFPPGEAHPETGYVVALPGNVPARLNPANGARDDAPRSE